MNDMIEKIQNKVKRYLDKDRYNHSLGVMYTAASLAMCHGEDIHRAMLAGILHDCAKCIPSDRKIKLCKKNHIPMTEIEYENPGLLHGKLGAHFAKTKYGINDPDVLGAITYHTTGKPDMTTLEKIIYIADYIEPNRRPLPGLPEARRLAYTDLDQCICHLLKDSLTYLKSKNIPIDPQTEMTYYFYMNENKADADQEGRQ